jgi:hypothetical protein
MRTLFERTVFFRLGLKRSPGQRPEMAAQKSNTDG